MKCCICKKDFEGFGNNPYPLCHKDDYESRCCNECDSIVIQARLDVALGKCTVAKVQRRYLGRECEPIVKK